MPLTTASLVQGQGITVKSFQQELEDVFNLDPGIVIKESMIDKKKNNQQFFEYNRKTLQGAEDKFKKSQEA